MIGVKYTGIEVLPDHPTGRWEPGEVKMFSRTIAIALTLERGDMILDEGKQEPKPLGPTKAKAKGKTKEAGDNG
jgi:hypothetical protein